MPWYQPLPPTVWWTFSASAVLASAYVLVFLARHPVDGESRIVDWSQRHRVPILLSGAVMVFTVLPNPIVLTAMLGLFLWIRHSADQWERDQTLPRGSAQYY